MHLEEGDYVVVPKTTGGLIIRPNDGKSVNIPEKWVDCDGIWVIHPVVKSTVQDIFRKLDLV